MDLTRASIVEIGDAVRAKTISAVEVTSHFLKRIENLDSRINSVVTVNPEALEHAKKVDAKIAKGDNPGRLAGVPLGIKDLLCTEGLRTTACSKILENFVPPYSATVVSRLEAEGAITIAKTSLDEFAMGSSNETSYFGPCRNPWNTDHVPGGSSGGSAAALSAGLVAGSIGTDTGGSIRQPASFCGVYGVKPTYGRVSRYGIVAFASSLDQAGPMAHSTADCALLLEVISGKCEFDSTSSPVEVPSWSQNLSSNLSGVRIGLPKEYFSDLVDKEVMAVTQTAIKSLEKRGVQFVDISLPLAKHAIPIYYLVATSEASSNLARYDGVRYGRRGDFSGQPVKDLQEFYSVNRGEGFGAEVKRRIMLGTFALSSGYYDAYYLKAAQVRRMLTNEFVEAFQKCDAMLSPVAATPPFKIGERIADPLQMYLNDIFTTSANLAGVPGMSVPGGHTKESLPIGVQLTAKHFNEQQIFDLSMALEQDLSLKERTPHVF